MESVAVIDIGSQTFKVGLAAGFPNEYEPRAVRLYDAAEGLRHMPAAVAPKTSPDAVRMPVVAGRIEDWDGMEALLSHAMTEELHLPAQSPNHHLVLLEPALTTREHRERLVQLAFEELGVQGLFVSPQSVASLYASGRTSGLVVDSGFAKTDATAIVEGVVLNAGEVRIPVGGRHLTQHLQRLARERFGLDLTVQAAEVLKAAVAQGGEEEGKPEGAAEVPSSSTLSTYKLPDGQEVHLPRTALADALAEAATTPALFGHPGGSLGDAVAALAAAQWDREHRRALLGALQVVGGGARLPELGPQLAAQVRASASAPVALVRAPEHMPPQACPLAAWMGGALLAKVVSAQKQWLTRAEYAEAGPAAVNKRCP